MAGHGILWLGPLCVRWPGLVGTCECHTNTRRTHEPTRDPGTGETSPTPLRSLQATGQGESWWTPHGLT